MNMHCVRRWLVGLSTYLLLTPSFAGDFCSGNDLQLIGDFTVYRVNNSAGNFIVSTFPKNAIEEKYGPGDPEDALTAKMLHMKAKASIGKYHFPDEKDLNLTLKGLETRTIRCSNQEMIAFVIALQNIEKR
jgi:hypothetical protein